MTAKKKSASKSTKPSTPAHGRSRRKIQKARKQARANAESRPADLKSRDELIRVSLTAKGMRATDDQIGAPVTADELQRRSDAVRAAGGPVVHDTTDGADDQSLRVRPGSDRVSNMIIGLLILAVVAVGWSVFA